MISAPLSGVQLGPPRILWGKHQPYQSRQCCSRPISLKWTVEIARQRAHGPAAVQHASRSASHSASRQSVRHAARQWTQAAAPWIVTRLRARCSAPSGSAPKSPARIARQAVRSRSASSSARALSHATMFARSRAATGNAVHLRVVLCPVATWCVSTRSHAQQQFIGVFLPLPMVT